MAYIGENAMDFEPLEMANIGSLGSLMLPELPHCDDLLIRQQLGAALREFCRESNACVVEMPLCAERAPDGSETQIPLPSPPSGMVLGTVLSICNADGDYIDFSVRLTPYPRILTGVYIGEGEEVLVRFSVYPKAGGENCPAWFKERYAEAIMAGAMHRLLGMANRPWSDPGRAAMYGAIFVDAIAEASYRSLGAPMEGGGASCIPSSGIFM